MTEKNELAVQDDSLFSGLNPELIDNLTPAKTRMILMYLTLVARSDCTNCYKRTSTERVCSCG